MTRQQQAHASTDLSQGSSRNQVAPRSTSAPLPSLLQRVQRTPLSLTPADLLHLQRTMGNHATMNLLQRTLASQPGAPEAAAQPRQRPLVQRRQDDEEQSRPPAPFAYTGRQAPEQQAPARATFVRSQPSRSAEQPSIQREANHQPASRRAFVKPIAQRQEERQEQAEVAEPLAVTAAPRGFIPLQRKSYVESPDATARQEAINEFYTQYNNVFANRYTDLYVDMQPRLADFAKATQGYALENYVSLVLRREVLYVIENIDQALKANSVANADKISEIVADMLMFASLVPSRIEVHKKTRFSTPRYQRLAAEVITPANLLDTLIGIAQSLTLGTDAMDSDGLKDIDFSDRDTIQQRMLKLTLANAMPAAREQLQKEGLFKEILQHPDILSVMMASGGAIEQNFLNTCTAAAVNQAIQSQVSSIIGLLQIGRGIANYVEQQASNNKPELEQRAKWSIKRVTVADVAKSRVQMARATFDNLETRAHLILQADEVDLAALQQLTREWSRAMQKLSAVIDLSKGTKNVPVLSNKALSEKWHTSTALTVASGVALNHPSRRYRGIEGDKYERQISEIVNVRSGSNLKVNPELDKPSKANRSRNLDILWERVFQAGGSRLDSDGHSVYVKAIRRGEEKVFAVGDPMIDKYIFKTMAEMDKYLRGNKHWQMPASVLRGQVSPAAYWLRDKVTLYNTQDDLVNQVTSGTYTHRIFDKILSCEETKHDDTGTEMYKVVVGFGKAGIMPHEGYVEKGTLAELF